MHYGPLGGSKMYRVDTLCTHFSHMTNGLNENENEGIKLNPILGRQHVELG